MAKHLINEKDEWAAESIKGYLYANNRDLIALKDFPNVVIRRDYETLIKENRVAILAGGGSGHEPAHLGFIGNGMLTGVVCGHLFASPSTAAISAAIKFVGAKNKAGVLLIIKNYTGDRLNFGLSAKRAQMEGIDVDWILVDDDVALLDKDGKTKNEAVGNRGLCATIIVEKIAGALAEQGKSLKEIKNYLDDLLAKRRFRTLGISLSGRVTLPGETLKDKTSEEASLIEVGLGIHGETGRTKMPLKNSASLAELTLKEYVLESSDNKIKDLCLMVNNLGGLSNLEIYLFANDCVQFIQNKRPDLRLRRLYCGTFMTSLNMNGFSVSSLYLEPESIENTLSLLDADTNALAWPKSCGKDIEVFEYSATSDKVEKTSEDTNDSDEYIKFNKSDADIFKSIFQTIAQDLIKIKEYLNKLDADCGDGDCGDSLSSISQVILSEIENGRFGDFEYPHKVFMHLSTILENGGGSLCILLALLFSAAAKAFKKSELSNQLQWLKMWSSALDLGLDAVQEYGRAKVNQRSIVDPLSTIQSTLSEYVKSADTSEKNLVETSIFLKLLVNNTLSSAESTAKMIPHVGRASYVNAATITTPDAGSMGISSVINSIHKAYLKNLSSNQ